MVGLVLDFLTTPMVELGDEFGIPPYLFLTSGASFLGLMLYHLTRHDLVDAELKNSD